MRDRLRPFIAILDWLARIHFVLYTLGGLSILAAIVPYLLGALVPALIFGAVGVMALALGVAGWLRNRQLDRDTAFWREHAYTNLGLAEIATELAEKQDREARRNRRPRKKARRRR